MEENENTDGVQPDVEDDVQLDVEDDVQLDVEDDVQTDEGEWVDVTDLFEGEEEPPTKEQILEGVRKENKKCDEREQQSLIKANSIGMSVGFFIAGIIVLVTTLVKDVFPYEVMMITCGMQAAQSIFVGVTVRRLRKLYLTLGVTATICAVTFSVVWVLNLCGVII